MKPHYLGHIVALAVTTCWGTTFVSSKVLLNCGFAPDEIFLVRCSLAYACLLALYHKRLWCSSWKDEALMLALGITGASLYFYAENTALMYDTSSNVSIFVGSAPLWTALLVGTIYRKERLNGKQWIGSFIAFAGMVLIVLNGQLVLHINPLGDTLAISAALIWALYSLIIRQVSGRYTAEFITRKIFFYGLVTIMPFILFKEHSLSTIFSLLSTLNLVIVGNFLFLGIIASTLCYSAWNWALSKIGTVRATNYIYIQSFITMIVAAIVLSERITPMAIIGVLILIIGMVMVQKKDRKESTTLLSND